MQITNRKVILLCSGLFVLFIAIVFVFTGLHEEQSRNTSTYKESDQWIWVNPLTSKEALIPPDWQQDAGRGTGDALLTLTHSSNRGVIYMVNESASGDLTLPEYVEAKKESLEKETGVTGLERAGEDRIFYEGEGAKYLGDTVTHTYVRLWSHDGDIFWRAAVITDSEYKDMEYEARKVVNLLMETTFR